MPARRQVSSLPARNFVHNFLLICIVTPRAFSSRMPHSTISPGQHQQSDKEGGSSRKIHRFLSCPPQDNQEILLLCVSFLVSPPLIAFLLSPPFHTPPVQLPFIAIRSRYEVRLSEVGLCGDEAWPGGTGRALIKSPQLSLEAAADRRRAMPAILLWPPPKESDEG